MTSFVLQSERVLLSPNEKVRPLALRVKNERVEKIGDFGSFQNGTKIFDCGSNVIMPGLIDTHVHINEPGRSDWEGFLTGARAAVAGGITTAVDMPLNSIPPTTTLENLNAKLAAFENQSCINFGFFGGVVPGNTDEIEPMIRAGVWGLKAFLVDSGVDEFPKVSEEDLNLAMPIMAEHQIPLLVHAELELSKTKASKEYKSYLDSRPEAWEVAAIEMMIGLSKRTDCPVHIVHLSSGEALNMIKNAKNSGIKISVETCPHYLTLKAEDIVTGATEFKCAPPIRDAENQKKLWAGLLDSTIDFIVSDHSPCLAKLKNKKLGDFGAAWGGISGLQLGLPLIWTQMTKMGMNDFGQILEWMGTGPARFLGLDHRKGIIQEGCDADLLVWNPEKTFKVDAKKLEHKNKISPYDGMELRGQVQHCIVGGQWVYNSGRIDPSLKFSPIFKEVKK